MHLAQEVVEVDEEGGDLIRVLHQDLLGGQKVLAFLVIVDVNFTQFGWGGNACVLGWWSVKVQDR